jgi:hypothetical protein
VQKAPQSRAELQQPGVLVVVKLGAAHGYIVVRYMDDQVAQDAASGATEERGRSPESRALSEPGIPASSEGDKE